MIDEVASVNKDTGISALWSKAAKLSINPCELEVGSAPLGLRPEPRWAAPLTPSSRAS